MEITSNRSSSTHETLYWELSFLFERKMSQSHLYVDKCRLSSMQHNMQDIQDIMDIRMIWRRAKSLKMTGRGPSKQGELFPEHDGKPILASSVQFIQSTLSKPMKLSKNNVKRLNPKLWHQAIIYWLLICGSAY